MFSSLLIFAAVGVSVARACCLPSQWQTTAFDLNSVDTQPYSMTIGHDDETRMEGVYIHLYGFDPVFKHFVKDFNTMTQYEIDMSGNCERSSLEDTFMSNDVCQLQDVSGLTNYQYYGKLIMGLPPNTIEVESSSFGLDGKVLYMGLSQNGCFPIYQKIKSTPGAPFPDMMLIYYNATASINDPALMNIPASCIGVAP